MLYQLLPLLDGWKDLSKKSITSVDIKAGNSYKLSEISSPGWILGLFVRYIGSPDATLAMELYDPFEGYRKITTSVSELLELGLDMPNPSSMYLAYYDLDENHYCIAFTPASPMPFYATRTRTSRITLVAPRDGDIKLKLYSQSVIGIVDLDRFIDSVKRVLAPAVPEIEKITVTREIAGLEELTEELRKLRSLVEELVKRPRPMEEILRLLPGVGR